MASAVKKQWMVDAPPREAVQPALPIVEVPESDACYDVRVSAENAEELRVLVGLPLLNLRWATVAIGIETQEFLAVLSAFSPPFAARDNVNVQFRDNHLDPELAHCDKSVFDLLERHAIDLVVALEANGVNGDFLV